MTHTIVSFRREKTYKEMEVYLEANSSLKELASLGGHEGIDRWVHLGSAQMVQVPDKDEVFFLDRESYKVKDRTFSVRSSSPSEFRRRDPVYHEVHALVTVDPWTIAPNSLVPHEDFR